MRRVLVLQHVAVEPLGTLLPLIKSYGLRIRYQNFERDPHAQPQLDGYDAVIVLGGPMSAWDDDGYPHLATETQVIADAIVRGTPVLGICLGAQLLARALGSKLLRAPTPEIGWHPVAPTLAAREDPIFQAFEETEQVFQWHSDTFELPEGAVQLARSAANGCAQQAFRYGDCAYGLQFHLEVDAPLIERWLNTPQLCREMERLPNPIEPAALRDATRTHIGRSVRLSDAVFSRFLEGWTDRPRRTQQPHR
jgi:GMP synthase (glutamine-hydrolysing)